MAQRDINMMLIRQKSLHSTDTFLKKTKTLLQKRIKKRLSQAYLFYSENDHYLFEIATYFVQENNACTLIENTTDCIIIEEEKSIKIEAIRSIQEQIKYGPSQHPTLFVIIKKANMLTKEASNAFLKTLESPPHNVCFILLTSSVHALLPTIKSRCQHLYCHYQQKNDVPSTLQSLTSIQNQSIIERLKTAEELSKDKPLAKQHLYHWLEESILSSQYKTQRNIFKKISQLEYNVNTRLQLENLLCYL